MKQSPQFESGTVFAKTGAGREEIQTRQLKLPPLVRRLLVLVDGKRSLQELSGFVPGNDAGTELDSLVSLACIEAVATDDGGSVSDPVPAARAEREDLALATALDGLPPLQSRSAKDTEMARHFMINSINRMLEQNSRLTLVAHIANSPDAAALREHYTDWEAAIGSSWMGARRLPELRKKLFVVL